MGRVADLEAVESLALGGGLAAAAGLFELLTGVVVLALGVAPAAHLAIAGATGRRGGRVLIARLRPALEAWTSRRLTLTHDLVERMAGQRTVVAQQPPELWHRDEARALADYSQAGGRLDGLCQRAGRAGAARVAAGGDCGAGAARRGRGRAPAAFVASVGGVLFVAGAFASWRRRFRRWARPPLPGGTCASLAAAARRASRWTRHRSPPRVTAQVAIGHRFVEARDAAFQYPGRPAPVLRRCSFAVRAGDRVLVEGASGGGKSTLAALLAGLREPTAGALRLDGVEQAAWASIAGGPASAARRSSTRTTSFPRAWRSTCCWGGPGPPVRKTLPRLRPSAASWIWGRCWRACRRGLEQLVGESGWQLSHGERGRLFIARALLQPLDARILDESFAALDPETLERAVACVLRRAGTLIVIAHPDLTTADPEHKTGKKRN